MSEAETHATGPGEIVTFTGRVFSVVDPQPMKVNIVDIAHALANNCRFTGHTSKFYSVAEHSVRVAEIVKERHGLAGLMHDASEAYLSDIASPVKRIEGFGEVYHALEDKLMTVIASRFVFPWPLHAEVRYADRVLLAAEQRDLMPRFRHEPGEHLYDETIFPWTPDFAEMMFLRKYEEITGTKPRR